MFFFYLSRLYIFFFFFFNDTATTEIYTLSLHDALPISPRWRSPARSPPHRLPPPRPRARDRKSTRLNSSHLVISYAVFCLKKKKKTHNSTQSLRSIARSRSALSQSLMPAKAKHCKNTS